MYTLKRTFGGRVVVKLEPTYERAALLGRFYDYEQRSEFQLAFEELVWCSYREDVGWGCMIRVIQMLLAVVLKRDAPQLTREQLIDMFRAKGDFGL